MNVKRNGAFQNCLCGGDVNGKRKLQRRRRTSPSLRFLSVLEQSEIVEAYADLPRRKLALMLLIGRYLIVQLRLRVVVVSIADVVQLQMQYLTQMNCAGR